MNEDELKKIIIEATPTDEEIKDIVKEIQNFMATLLQQEYRYYGGTWWLFSLGKPARPLTTEEIKEHRQRGEISND